ncbi:hypothetical protein [Spirosoma foliorum]|nr:hypothetical protein [Spirosoma foliorum]
MKIQVIINQSNVRSFIVKAMTFEPASQLLAFVLPMSFLKGDLIFHRGNPAQEDIHIPITPTLKPRQVVSTAQLAKGIWQVCLNWSDGRLQYLEEKVINID